MTALADEPAPARSYCPTCRAVFRGAFRRCPSDGAALVASDVDPMIGTVLAERYLIEAVIGDGGLGRVYRARHVRMSRRFAVKVPFGEVGYDRKSRARLMNEAEAASRLAHPNVIGVVDVGETPEGLFYLAMDLADGPTLGDVVARGRVAPSDVMTLLAQLADGLAHAHERGMVHRDLKPDNVVVTLGPDGGLVPRVIDFGLALLEEAGDGDRLTTAGLVVGTPCYMAPEQATGGVLDHRTDLFALGIMLFELLAGCLPFDGSPIEIARQNVEARLPTVMARSGRPTDPLLEAMVAWLTRRRRDDRPADTRVIATFARRLLARDRAGAVALLPAALVPAGALVAPPSSTPATASAMVPDPVALAALSAAPTDATPIVATVAVVDAAAVAAEVPLVAVAVPLLNDLGAAAPTTLAGAVVVASPPRPSRGAVVAAPARWPWLVALVAVAAIMIVVLSQRSHPRTPTAAVAPTVETAATAPAPTAAPTTTAPTMTAPIVDAPDAATARPSRAAPTARPDVAPAPPSMTAAPPSMSATATTAAPPATPIARAQPSTRPAPSPAVVAPPPRLAPSLQGQSLKTKYGRVAAELDAAVSRLGAGRTAELRRRFAAMPPYLDAVRKPELRTAAESQLAAIARDLDQLPR